MQQEEQQRACGKSTGLLGGKQEVNNFTSEKLWAKGGLAATWETAEGTEMGLVKRTHSQARREQGPQDTAATSFFKASFPMFKCSLVFIVVFSRRNNNRQIC